MFFNLFGLLQKEQVLANAIEHMILTPHVSKSSSDIVWKIRIYSTATEKPKHRSELNDDKKDRKKKLSQHRKG